MFVNTFRVTRPVDLQFPLQFAFGFPQQLTQPTYTTREQAGLIWSVEKKSRQWKKGTCFWCLDRYDFDDEGKRKSTHKTRRMGRKKG
jgi:hypothetical protein